MAEQVPHEVKIERMERLVEVTQRIAAERNAARVGRVEEVLVEGPSRTDDALLRGRTRRNTTVNFTGDAAAGELVEVRIEHATSTTLRGRAGGARGRRPHLAGLAGAHPHHRLVRADRHEPRAQAHRRRPLGLRRRQAREHLDATSSRPCSRTSPGAMRRSRAASTRSSTRRSTSSSTWRRTRRSISLYVSRAGRSRT